MLAFAAALASGMLALAVACTRRWSIARRCFCIGMVLLAVDSVLANLANKALVPEATANWLKYSLIAESFLPGVWLTFSIAYSRGNYREFLKRWQFVLVAAFMMPVGVAIGVHSHLVEIVSNPQFGLLWIKMGDAARILNGALLVGIVLILMNLERTFRSAVGTMRWRIKFLILGLVVIFGARIYTRTQGVLFSGFDPAWSIIEAAGLLVGCMLIGIGYVRGGFEEVDVYPSRAVLQSSVTVVLVGGYLFVVGVLAQFVAAWGGSENLPLQAALVLVAITVLAVFLLSDRARQAMKRVCQPSFQTAAA